MYTNNSNHSRAASARAALFAIMLAIGLGLMAFPAEAQPFAYVTNLDDGTVSVINTATSTVVGTPIGVGNSPRGVAVTPDGQHAYVANAGFNNVSVIAAASNTVVATVPVGNSPIGIAITPDGTHAYVANANDNTVSVIATATNTVVGIPIPVGTNPNTVAITPDGTLVYVTNSGSNNVSVIATASNMVAATVTVGSQPYGVAVTQDGTHVYVANFNSNNVSVIATASNTLVATIPVGNEPFLVAITPDGTRAYVTNVTSNNVSVIATASNTVVATVPVGGGPGGLAVTPDGQHAYVLNSASNTVSVIATASNTVVGTQIQVGNFPLRVGIIPDVPFLAFSAQLTIQFGGKPNQDAFKLQSSFTLSSTAPGINPVTEPVTLQVGPFAATIPPGSFNQGLVGELLGTYTFVGTINGVSLNVLIAPTGTLRYAVSATATGVTLTGTVNPVTVRLSIGDDSGTTPVTATYCGGLLGCLLGSVL